MTGPTTYAKVFTTPAIYFKNAPFGEHIPADHNGPAPKLLAIYSVCQLPIPLKLNLIRIRILLSNYIGFVHNNRIGQLAQWALASNNRFEARVEQCGQA